MVAALLAGPVAAEPTPIEDYPSYEPAARCSPTDKAGTVRVAQWIVRRYGGGLGGISRACSGRHGTSEHHEGRAFDWTVSVSDRADRERVQRFLRGLFATDRAGNEHARARRMGVMYVIWNDRMYAAWDSYEPKRYQSSSCPRIRTCSRHAPAPRPRAHLAHPPGGAR